MIDNELADRLDSFLGLSIDDPEVSVFLNNIEPRIWYPNTLGTSDFVPDRINVVVDKDNFFESWHMG